MLNKKIVVAALAATMICVAAVASADHKDKERKGKKKDRLVRQPTVELVVAEHLDALNNCDVDRLMAQYPERTVILLPGGVTVGGRTALRELFEGFCLPASEGGLKGIYITELESWKVGKTINVQWTADACFLKEPYLGADAYITGRGLMLAQVTTFDGAELNIDETKLNCAD